MICSEKAYKEVVMSAEKQRPLCCMIRERKVVIKPAFVTTNVISGLLLRNDVRAQEKRKLPKVT